MPRPKPIAAGTRFGQLMVTRDRSPGEPRVHVRCDCGRSKTVSVNNLGRCTNSCGYCRVLVGECNPNYRHGKAGQKIYWIWADMVSRCTNSKHVRFADYGGRGIKVCRRWMSFDNFYSDMGDRPANRSLDRLNNNRGYSPANCRWATASEQASNKRSYGLEYRTRDSTGKFLPGSTRC